ncbi:hypothetical protein QE152_g9220 [Popillia japonica]|uniref:Uncharacterized protein n=1 Tax=Popillia japonica TaxID=7064 RepID=A0AAW1LYW6_POPJA
MSVCGSNVVIIWSYVFAVSFILKLSIIMLQQTAEGYAKTLNVNLDERLQPVGHSVDEMLTRLEELDTMIALVQQERCNSIGITDALEKVVDDAKNNIDMLEIKVDAAEKHLGITDNATKFKNFLAPIFKKTNPEEPSSTEIIIQEPFSVAKYFTNVEQASDNL